MATTEPTDDRDAAGAAADVLPYVAVFAVAQTILSAAGSGLLGPFGVMAFLLSQPPTLAGAALAAGLLFRRDRGRAPRRREVLTLTAWSVTALMVLSLSSLGLSLATAVGADAATGTGPAVPLLLPVLFGLTLKAASGFVVCWLCYGPLLQSIDGRRLSSRPE